MGSAVNLIRKNGSMAQGSLGNPSLFLAILCICLARFFCCYRKVAISDKLLILIPF